MYKKCILSVKVQDLVRKIFQFLKNHLYFGKLDGTNQNITIDKFADMRSARFIIYS